MAEEQINEVLDQFNGYLQISDIFLSTVRLVGWWLIKLLIWLVDSLNTIFGTMGELLGFYNSDKLVGESAKWSPGQELPVGDSNGTSILETLRPLQGFLLLVAIVLVGFMLYRGKTNEVRETPLNIAMTMMILMMLPTVVGYGVTVVQDTFGAFSNTYDNPGKQVFIDNVTDVYQLGSGGWTTTDPDVRNHLDDIRFFNINEKIEDASKVDNGLNVLDYKLVDKVGGKGFELQKMAQGDGLLDSIIKSMIGEYYYRWSWNWPLIFFSLVAMAGAYVVSLLRVGRLAVEIGFNYLYAQIVAFFDVRTMQRFKEVITSIFGTLAAIIAIIVMYYMFGAYASYINSSSIGAIGKIFGLLGGAWFIFDGPNIIQKTLGVDAGLSGAYGVLAGAVGASKIAQKAKSAVSATKNAAAEAGGFAKGASDGMKEKNKGVNDEVKKSENEPDKDKNTGVNDSMNGKDDKEEKNQGVNSETNPENNQDKTENEGVSGEIEDNVNGESSNQDINTEGSVHAQVAETGDNEVDSDGKNTGGINSEISSQQDSEKSSGMESEIEDKSDKELNGNGINESNEKPQSSTDGNKNMEDKAGSSVKSELNQSENSKTNDLANKKSDKLDKPKNPILGRVKEEALTPKMHKNNKGAIGNTIEHAQKGQSLGKDWTQYVEDKKAYKVQQKELKIKEKDQKISDRSRVVAERSKSANDYKNE